VFAQIEAVQDINNPFIVFTAIIKRDADGMNNVILKMLPDAGGKRFEKLARTDQSIVVSYEVPLNNLGDDDLDDLAIVVFVQEIQTKEIHQSAIIDLDESLILTGLDELSDGTKYILYPNPASDKVSIKLMSPVTRDTDIKVFDQFGKMVHTQLMHSEESLAEIDVDRFASGVYIIQLESKNEVLMRNKFIVSH